MISVLLRMELYKFFHRKSCLFLIIFPMLPLFYGIGKVLKWNGVIVEGEISAINFASTCWMLLGYTGIANIIFVIIIANSFSSELRYGQMRLFKLRCNGLDEIFDAKCISVAIKVFTSYVLLYLVAIIVFYECLADELHVYGLFHGFSELISCGLSDFLVTEQLILVCVIEVLACSMFTTSTSIIIGILASLAPLIIGYIPILKYLDIEDILELYNDSQISTSHIILFGCLYVVIILVPLLYARKKYIKVDVC